jgi:hypothetical protein
MSDVKVKFGVPISENHFPAAMSSCYVSKRYSAAATSLVFSGMGGLHTVVIGTKATGGVVELFDDINTSSPANQIAKIDASVVEWFLLDVVVVNGLVIKLTNAPDVTISVIARDVSLYG